MIGKKTESEVEYLRRRVEELTAEIIGLKREGFDPPAAQPPQPQDREEIAGEIMAAIRDVAEWGTEEYYGMVGEAGALCAAHPEWDAKRIAQEVTQGSPLNPYRL